MKRLLVLIAISVFWLSGCQMKSDPSKEMDLNNEKEVSVSRDISPFSLSDLLIDGHELLGKCPYWNMNWEILKAESPAIKDTYFDTFPGTPDMQLMYAEGEGITYVTYDNYIAAIILTDDTYRLHAGIMVGDALTQTLIEQYNLKYFGKSSSDENATIMTGVERKSSQKLDYDCVFSGTTFIPQEENDLFMKTFLENNNFEETFFGANETGIAVSFYVKEGIIVGICMEYIV